MNQRSALTICHRAFVLAVCLKFADVIALHAQEVPAKPLPLVILLGDSIRINYQGSVSNALAGKAAVWAPSANGQDTTYTLRHLAEWLKDREPAVIHINCGLHDLFLGKETGKPRHSLDEYATHLRAVFKRLRELTDARIIFALTTAVDETRQVSSKSYGRVVRHNSDIDVYNARARNIAREFQIVINDLNGAAKQHGIARMIREDGAHLSPEGIKILGQQVTQSILAQLPKQ